jgi:hypothetical protein
MSNSEKLNDFRQDAGRLGIAVIPPSVQTSFRHFETGDNRIYYCAGRHQGRRRVGGRPHHRGARRCALCQHRGLLPADRSETGQPPGHGKPDLGGCLRLFRPRSRRTERRSRSHHRLCAARARGEGQRPARHVRLVLRLRAGNADFSVVHAVDAVRKADARISGARLLSLGPPAGCLYQSCLPRCASRTLRTFPRP